VIYAVDMWKFALIHKDLASVSAKRVKTVRIFVRKSHATRDSGRKS